MIILTCILVCIVMVLEAQASNYKRVCYYTNWSQYRHGASYRPNDYQPGLCTHIIYAFAKVNSSADETSFGITNYEWNDASWGYPGVIGLRSKDPGLKVLLAIGGWTHGSNGFTQMVRTAERRLTFVRAAVHYLKLYGFDGLDLDWEYPTQIGGGWIVSPPEDKQRFTLLCKELKEAFNQEDPPLLLTAAVGANTNWGRNAYEIVEISKVLNFINLMTYDLAGHWDAQTGHQTDAGDPNRDNFNIIKSVNYWLNTVTSDGTKMDPGKLVLGLASYGRTAYLPNACNSWEINSNSGGGGAAGAHTASPGFLAYYEICDKQWQNLVCANDADNIVNATYGSDGRDFIGYDDQDSIVHKIQIMKSKSLGGYMFWALDLDDFSSRCNDGRYGKYPLMMAAKNATLNLPLNIKSCQSVRFTGTCPVTTTTTIESGGCRVNPNGAWKDDPAMDIWCRNKQNCPSSLCGDYTTGCPSCQCLCNLESTTASPGSTVTEGSATAIVTSTLTTTSSSNQCTVSSLSDRETCYLNENGDWKGDQAVALWCETVCPTEPSCSTQFCCCTNKITTTIVTESTSTMTEREKSLTTATTTTAVTPKVASTTVSDEKSTTTSTLSETTKAATTSMTSTKSTTTTTQAPPSTSLSTTTHEKTTLSSSTLHKTSTPVATTPMTSTTTTSTAKPSTSTSSSTTTTNTTCEMPPIAQRSNCRASPIWSQFEEVQSYCSSKCSTTEQCNVLFCCCSRLS